MFNYRTHLEPAVILVVVLALLTGVLVSELSAQDDKDATTIVDLQEKADSGDLNSMVLLGEYYRDSTRPDFEKALLWFRKAADQGSSIAMERLGGMYRDGYGVDKNYAIAVDWYKKAADAGDLTAMASIGWMHYHGLGLKKDVSEALRWYRTAAEKGGHEGMNNLGHLYLNGLGVKQDVQEAIHWFRKSAAAGNPYGYDNLGVLYLQGNGVPKDIESAKKMFRMAAKLGLTDSMIRMGRLERANDSPKAHKAAFDWFFQARASMEGMRELGNCYLDGVGVEPDADEGLRWYLSAIDAGHPFAPADLADRLLTGRGLKADPAKAKAILEKAALNGNAGAATKLGHIASKSSAYEEALKYYRMAANLGEPTAMFCIAIQYKNGWGVTRDDEEALNWLRKAAEHGNDHAKQVLSKLNKRGQSGRTNR